MEVRRLARRTVTEGRPDDVSRVAGQPVLPVRSLARCGAAVLGPDYRGAGAWGTALAQITAAKGEPVTLWARDEVLSREINAQRENKRHLEGIPLSENINATSVLPEALKAQIILNHSLAVKEFSVMFLNSVSVLNNTFLVLKKVTVVVAGRGVMKLFLYLAIHELGRANISGPLSVAQPFTKAS